MGKAGGLNMHRLVRFWLLWILALALTACGGGSAGSDSTPPTAVIQTNVKVLTTQPVALQAALGSQISLDGSSSTAPGSSIKSYAWTLTSKPAASTAPIDAPTSAQTGFTPDVPGSYVLSLTIVDANNKSSTQTVTLVVIDGSPVVNITDQLTFQGGSTTRPAQSISVGSIVTLDGSASTDPTGSAVTVSWTWLEQPSGSKATLTSSGSSTFFSADVAGQYRVRARGTNASGQYTDVISVYTAVSDAPSMTVAANITSLGTSTSLTAAVGNLVVLDSSASSIPAGHAVTRTWGVLVKPVASTSAALSSTSTNAISFVPDAAGDYLIRLTLLDNTTGISSTHTITVTVTVKQGPAALIAGNATPVALVTAPGLVTSAGVPVTLRGSGSYDPSGSALTYVWSITSKPASSTASITQPNQADISFTPDRNGNYVLQLQVSNPTGDISIRSVSVFVGNYPPVVALNASQLTSVTGSAVTVSASASAASGAGQSSQPLSYSWSIDARPQGSTATIAAPTTAILNFTPDVAGSYYASVTVTQGSVSSIAAVTITAIAPTPGTVKLGYAPLQVKYSKSLGKAVIVSTNPNTLHLVDPNTSNDTSITLPAAVKNLSLSPDGKLAAVLHEGAVSMIDLTAGTLVHSSTTSGSQTEALISNTELIYLTGQTGGQWVSPAFTVINGRTGTTVQTNNSFAIIYGDTRAIYADTAGKIFTISLGLSPAQIYAYSVDATTGNIGTSSQSPYWGDYGMSAPFWLSGDQSLLFTGSGTYFNTSDLTYSGNLGVAVQSMSHSGTAQEAVVLAATNNYYYGPVTYPSVYKHYTGALLFPASDVSLPTVIGAQSYGLFIFHASDDKLVMVVQTGNAQANASGIEYYLLLR
jgi:hypothetical protein